MHDDRLDWTNHLLVADWWESRRHLFAQLKSRRKYKHENNSRFVNRSKGLWGLKHLCWPRRLAIRSETFLDRESQKLFRRVGNLLHRLGHGKCEYVVRRFWRVHEQHQRHNLSDTWFIDFCFVTNQPVDGRQSSPIEFDFCDGWPIQTTVCCHPTWHQAMFWLWHHRTNGRNQFGQGQQPSLLDLRRHGLLTWRCNRQNNS